MPNRSLDEFAGDTGHDDESESTPTADASTAEGDAVTDDDGVAVDPETVDPATPTYRYAPDGEACQACGEEVEKLWDDDQQFVCLGCKSW